MRESGDDGIDWEIENISYELICCMVKWEILSILPSIPYIRSFHSFIHISNFNQMVIYSITLFVLIKYTFYFTLCCAMQCQDMQMPCHNRDRMRWAAIQSDVMCSMYSQSFWISKFFYFQTIPSHPLVSAVPFASSSLPRTRNETSLIREYPLLADQRLRQPSVIPPPLIYILYLIFTLILQPDAPSY